MTLLATHRPEPTADRHTIVLVSSLPDPVRTMPVLRTLEVDVRVVLPAELGAFDVGGRTVLVDVRRGAEQVLARLRAIGARGPDTVIAVTDTVGLPAVDPGWQVDDVVLDTAPRAELAARLRLRRDPRRSCRTGTPADRLAIGELVIDCVQHVVSVADREVELTYREFRLLTHLAQHVGEVVGRQELMRVVWERPEAVAHRTIDVHVARLRRKLGPRQGELLHTVRKVGYRLTQPKEHVSAA